MRLCMGMRAWLLAGGLAILPGAATATILDIPGVELQPGRPRRGDTLEQSVMPTREGQRPELERLQLAVEVLKTHELAKFEVAGHADEKECEESFQCNYLSERRAQLVFRYLLDHGIDAHRLLGLSGYGTTRPIVSEPPPPDRDRSLNRRVEINTGN